MSSGTARLTDTSEGDLSLNSSPDLEKQHSVPGDTLIPETNQHHSPQFHNPRSTHWLLVSLLLNALLAVTLMLLLSLYITKSPHDGDLFTEKVDTTKELRALGMTPSWLPPEGLLPCTG